MDLQQITDINQLKAMAFDQIQAIEQSQNNLRLIQQRLVQVQQNQATDDTEPSES